MRMKSIHSHDELRYRPSKKTRPNQIYFHGVWSLGIILMRRIGFGSKALVVSALFALPLVLVSVEYMQAQSASISFSAKERLGLHYIGAVYPLLKSSLLLRSGNPKNTVTARSDLEKSLDSLTQIQHESGYALATTEAFDKMKKTHDELFSGKEGDPITRFYRHTEFIQSVIFLINAAADGSNLTLDPDIDTHYLMDAIAFRLPDLVERIGLNRLLKYLQPVHVAYPSNVILIPIH